MNDHIKKFSEYIKENEEPVEEVGETEEQSIELDCPPGSPRPDDLFPDVIKDTGLEADDFELTSKFFGNWIWSFKNKSKLKVFQDAKPELAKRIKALYDSGKIRYGSW